MAHELIRSDVADGSKGEVSDPIGHVRSDPNSGSDRHTKSRRRVEKIGDGFAHGHDTQPAPNLAVRPK
jgi:hypothetical protein